MKKRKVQNTVNHIIEQIQHDVYRNLLYRDSFTISYPDHPINVAFDAFATIDRYTVAIREVKLSLGLRRWEV